LHFGARFFFWLTLDSDDSKSPKDLIFLMGGFFSPKVVTGVTFSIMSDESYGMFYDASS
jgi:hypothetical protein